MLELIIIPDPMAFDLDRNSGRSACRSVFGRKGDPSAQDDGDDD